MKWLVIYRKKDSGQVDAKQKERKRREKVQNEQLVLKFSKH
jgi:hypothetical protein